MVPTQVNGGAALKGYRAVIFRRAFLSTGVGTTIHYTLQHDHL